MRIRQLEEIQQRFAVQQNRVIDLRQLLEETQEQIREQLIADPKDDIIDPILSQQRFKYIKYLKLQAEHLENALRKEEQILEIIREEMRQAHVKKRSLELLEEKQKKAYIKNLEIQEMKEMEDLITGRRLHSRSL